MVSADSDNPARALPRFGNINPKYVDTFKAFSPERLFSPVGSNIADVTFFVNVGRDHPYDWDMNQVDPRIGYQAGNAVTASVRNPLFNLLPPTRCPAPCGRSRTSPSARCCDRIRNTPP
jgi:hypothetical protein